MNHVDLKCRIISIFIEVVFHFRCCNGRVVTKIMEWQLVHMMKSPFAHWTATCTQINTTILAPIIVLVCHTRSSNNLTTTSFLNDIIFNIIGINFIWWHA